MRGRVARWQGGADDRLSYTLWPANVRRHSFEGQVAAAAESSYDAIAINSATYVACRRAGLRPAELRRMTEDAGVRVAWVDAVTGWLPIRYPPGSPELKGFLDHKLDVAFEIAAELGCDRMLAIGCFDRGAVSFDEQSECFAALCRRTEREGIAVALEFIPMWGIADLEAAWSLVTRVEAPNSGLLIDTWHFFRSGSRVEDLAPIPDDRIFAVQLADAVNEVKGGGLLADCLDHRLPPGEGELPLQPLLSALLSKGVPDAGPEIFSLAMDDLEAKAAAKRALASTRSVLASAGRAL